jgi:LysR family glycine cleavage system transcriptional activator
MTKRIFPSPVRALRVFVIAARHLNFIDASKELLVTPAAVSNVVRGLEEYLGYSLFKRGKRGMNCLSLTEEGQYLFPKLSQAFDSIDATLAEVLDKCNKPETKL